MTNRNAPGRTTSGHPATGRGATTSDTSGSQAHGCSHPNRATTGLPAIGLGEAMDSFSPRDIGVLSSVSTVGSTTDTATSAAAMKVAAGITGSSTTTVPSTM